VTWNVQILKEGEDQELVMDDLRRHGLALAALQECRWEKIEVGKRVGPLFATEEEAGNATARGFGCFLFLPRGIERVLE